LNQVISIGSEGYFFFVSMLWLNSSKDSQWE